MALYSNNNLPAAHTESIKRTVAAVSAFKDDPRIYAWALVDEPMNGIDPSNRADMNGAKQLLEDSYRAVRDIDDRHPTYIVDNSNVLEAVKYTDIFNLDNYSGGANTSGITTAIHNLTTKHPRIPIYELAKAYDTPPINAMRNSVYRALEAGASAAGFFSFSDAADFSKANHYPIYLHPVWDDFVALNSIEIPILYDLYVHDKAVILNSYDSGDPEYGLVWKIWQVEGNTYLLAHNKSTAPTLAPLSIPYPGEYIATPVGLSARPLATGGNDNPSISARTQLQGSDTIPLGVLASEEIALYQLTAPPAPQPPDEPKQPIDQDPAEPKPSHPDAPRDSDPTSTPPVASANFTALSIPATGRPADTAHTTVVQVAYLIPVAMGFVVAGLYLVYSRGYSGRGGRK